MKRVIVTGSRDFTSYYAVSKALAFHLPDLVIHGGANGADSMAETWARNAERDSHIFRPRWRTAAGYIKSAGHTRNGRMLDAYPGVLVLAFPHGEAKGTRNCIEQALTKGHEVWVYGGEGELEGEVVIKHPAASTHREGA